MILLICKWEHKVEVQVCIVSWASALLHVLESSLLATLNSSFTNRTLCWNHTQLLLILCRRYFLFHNNVFSKACFLCLKSILGPQAYLQSLITLQVSLGHRLHEGFLLLLLSRGPHSCALLTFQLQNLSHCMQIFAYKSFLSTSSIASKPPKIWASQRVRKRIHGGERGKNIIIFVYVAYCLLFTLCMFYLWKYILFCACVLRRFSHVWLFATPWKVALQAPLSMGFSRQEYWSGLPFSPPGDLLDSRVEFASLNISCIGRRIFLQW